MTIIVLTGAPGVGKTSAVMRVARELKERGVKVGGIVSRELKTNNTRIGFLPQMIEMFWHLSLEMVSGIDHPLSHKFRNKSSLLIKLNDNGK